MVKWFLLSLLVCLFSLTTNAQTTCCSQKADVYFHKSIDFKNLPILFESVKIYDSKNNQQLPQNLYTVFDNYLLWEGKDSISISIHYQNIPPFLLENSFRLDTHLIAFEHNPNHLIEYEIPKNSEQTHSNDMNYEGSFSRGITFGNNHDLVLNSGLNLQMDGIIGNEIIIKAAVSDKNIPLQPEGNTQQLKEFDRIFIQIEKNEQQLMAGDYNLKKSNHFLKYNKNLQGASFQNNFHLKNGTITNRGSIAISKGNFQRQNLHVFEGNQGPYKLIGSNNESFIIVLSNTEKVFLDGKLLLRGTSNDYTIDYNQGEIFFTPKIPINNNSRIVIEFEYATQNYLKSLYAFDTEFKNESWSLNFSLFSEQESKNSSGLSDLSIDEKKQLAQAGDFADKHFFSGIQSKIDPINPILYLPKDTMVNGILYENILVYNPTINDSNKSVKFTNLGDGNGHYIRTNSSANGTVFQWISPDIDGNLQGNYDPIVKLIAPTKHQIYNLASSYQISKNSKISSEISFSNFDKNRFSKKDGQDNIGWAWNTMFDGKKQLGKQKNWTLTSHLNYEFVDGNYKSYSPFRDPEFDRNWNINTQNSQNLSHFLNSDFKISKDSFGFLSYNLNSFIQPNLYTGILQSGKIFLQKNGWELMGNGHLLSTQSNDEETQFFKPSFDISKSFQKLKNWKLGYSFEQEKNQRIQADTLSIQSFYFNQSKLYVESQKTEKLFVGTHFLTRNDFTPKLFNFQKNINSQEYGVLGNWNPTKSFRLEGSLIQRTIKIDHQEWTDQIPKKYQLGQANLNYSPLNGAIQVASNYEIGGGQEAKIEYNYLEVNSGQGIYQWLDYNQDSIQQINEFEIAPYPDQATYVRIILPTQSYIATNFLKFNQSLSFIPKAKWHDSKKKIMQWINLFSTQSSYFINRRTNNKNDIIDWNPFISRRNDSLLIADNQSIRNTIFINRASTLFNGEIGMTDNLQKNILTTGSESLDFSDIFTKLHAQLSKGWDFYLSLNQGLKTKKSEYFINKNYKIKSKKASIKLTTIFNDKWRNSFAIEYLIKDNVVANSNERLVQKSTKINIQYNQTDATSIAGMFSFSHIQYNGDINTPISYEMLNGLQNGLNFLWSLQIHKKISKFVYLNVGYTGRKTGINKMIHLGNLQMIAQF